jgi:hypothetical protein
MMQATKGSARGTWPRWSLWLACLLALAVTAVALLAVGLMRPSRRRAAVIVALAIIRRHWPGARCRCAWAPAADDSRCLRRFCRVRTLLTPSCPAGRVPRRG